MPMRSAKPALLRSSALLLLTPAARAFSVGSIPGVEAYTHLLAAHPLETKVSTAAALAVLGDGIAQRSIPAPYDKTRALSFVLFDASYRGGFQHQLFPWIIDNCRGEQLQQLLGASEATAAFAAVESTAFNQLVIVPVVYYPLFFAVTGAVQGLTTEQSLARARSQFGYLTLRNWSFWVPAQFCQFAFLDLEWQVPYTCVMGLAWNIILSAWAGDARVALPEAEESQTGVVVPTALGLSEKDAAGAAQDVSEKKGV
jgi:hypothetical protein